MFTSLRGKLLFILIVLTVSAVVISSGYFRYMQRQFALDRARERAAVDLRLIGTDIRTVLQWVYRDLLVLRDLPQLGEYLDANHPLEKMSALRDVETAFLALANHHRIFQQIRFLDHTGQETVRVNFDGKRTILVPHDELQDKKNRYYFKDSFRLANGQVYISPMDLNVEQGRIERPYVPVMRYATPVYDQKGRKRGVIVLNVFGSAILNLMAKQQKQVQLGERYYLLNSDGYFLFHPDAGKTFGFMFNNGKTMFREEAELEEVLADNADGMIITRSAVTGKDTLFAFQRIFILPQAVQKTDAEHTRVVWEKKGRNYWTLLTAVDDAELLVGFGEYVQSFLLFTLILIVACVLAAWFVAWSCARPVLSLAAAARKIEKGDLSARATIFSRDDMGQFGKLFNSMAAKLEDSISKLKESEEKYRRIFENSRDSIFVTDTKCRIIDINRAGKELLGIGDDDEPRELSLSCCRSTPQTDEERPLLEQTMQDSGFVKNFETYLARADGSIRICLMTATARYDESGELIGYEGILRDITEERQQQEAERNFQKKLQEEIVMAEERERRHIGQLLHEEMAQNLALVSLKLQESEQHVCDLRPPGGAVPASCFTRELRTSKMLVKQMIRQIRTMIFDLYPAILDDQGLVAAMQWYGKNFTRRTGINISVYDFAPDLSLTDSQKVYLFRAFKELLHNAWKHAGAGEIVATAKAGNGRLRITVDDEGRGFVPENELDTSRTIKGIGLASIQQWVSAMEGSLSVESEPDKGTRVVIDIPVENDSTGSGLQRERRGEGRG